MKNGTTIPPQSNQMSWIATVFGRVRGPALAGRVLLGVKFDSFRSAVLLPFVEVTARHAEHRRRRDGYETVAEKTSVEGFQRIGARAGLRCHPRRWPRHHPDFVASCRRLRLLCGNHHCANQLKSGEIGLVCIWSWFGCDNPEPRQS